MERAAGNLVVGLLAIPPLSLGAQAPPAEIVRERAEFVAWLKAAPTSPFRAIVQHSIGAGITLGPPDSDVPLAGVGRARLEERGQRLSLTVDGAARPIARDRPTPLGSFMLLAAGLPGRAVATLYGGTGKPAATPTHFAYSDRWRLPVGLTPTREPKTQRILAPDGTEVEATEAGTVTFSAGGRPVTLRVLRVPAPGGEESELEIYFRDGTNDRGTYPAGRFVNLVPSSDGRYWLDFNRARNPFCAYSTVYPCPAPWRGNTIPTPIEAGEKYHGGGLTPKLPPNS